MKDDFGNTAGWMALVIFISLGMGCSKSTPSGPDIPVPVTLQFDVFNHTQGYKTSFTRSTTSGQSVIISVGDLGVLGVDPQRVAVRKDNFGSLVEYSSKGQCGITAQKQNTSYDIILFNASNNAPYQWMDYFSSHLYKDKRNYNVYRKDFDGQTGPEDVWANVFGQLNAALDLGFVKWGSISRQTSGDFSYGYGDSYGNAGWHAGSFITINPKQCSNELVMTIVGLAEAFENICQVDNIGGHSSGGTIATGGVLNPIGKDLFAYIFAKDSSK